MLKKSALLSIKLMMQVFHSYQALSRRLLISIRRPRVPRRFLSHSPEDRPFLVTTNAIWIHTYLATCLMRNMTVDAIESIFSNELIYTKMRRTGAQERSKDLEPKATNKSVIRLSLEPNLCSYERNRGLFSTVQVQQGYN